MKANALMVFAIIAVAFALFNLIITIDKVGEVTRLTGFAPSDIGEANLTILTQVSIIFTKDSVQWGSGYFNSTQCPNLGDRAVLITDNGTGPSITCGVNWVADRGLNLSNVGNVKANITLRSSNNPTGFIGSSGNPTYQWRVTEGTATSCETTPSPSTSYQTISTTDIVICSNLTSQVVDPNNRLVIDLNVSFDSGASPGFKQSILTATGTANP